MEPGGVPRAGFQPLQAHLLPLLHLQGRYLGGSSLHLPIL